MSSWSVLRGLSPFYGARPALSRRARASIPPRPHEAPSSPVTVTTAPSLSDPLYIGDFFDTTATNRWYHLVWTDRGDKRDPGDGEDDILIRTY
jgi:hypothetical protein